MEKVKLYFIFTDTGTHLSKMINFFTRQSLNHVSLGFNVDLTEVYSFGRKNPRNPFVGGFVREDIRGEFLKDANCAIYSFDITKQEYELILKNIKIMEKKQEEYRYNFIGLLGVLFQIRIKRKRAFFCSQFVATVLKDIHSVQLSKPCYFVTPLDIRTQLDLKLIYEGRLGDYQNPLSPTEKALIDHPKHSFIFYMSKAMKRIVAR